MCGIAGFIDFSRSRSRRELDDVSRMSNSLAHRGPDDGGVWSNWIERAWESAWKARAPMLDHRIIEFVWQLPENLRIRNGQTKWLLRRIFLKYIPKSLVDRPKLGFGVPVHEWLRRPLRDWAEELIGMARLSFMERAHVPGLARSGTPHPGGFG